MTFPWVKLYREERGSFGQLPLIVRAMAGQLLKAVDDDGRFFIGGMPPADAVARYFGATTGDRRQLRKILPQLIDDGFCSVDSGWIIIANFDRFQSKKQPRKTREPVANLTRDLQNDQVRDQLATEIDSSRSPNKTQVPEIIPRALDKRRGDKRRGDIEKVNQKEDRAAPLSDSSLGDLDLLGEPVEKPDPIREAARVRAEGIRETFEHWRKVLGSSRSKLTDGRVKKIGARLDEGYSLDELKAAIDGIATSDFHKSSGHTSIDLIFRTGAKAEEFAAMLKLRPGHSKRIGKGSPAPPSDWAAISKARGWKEPVLSDEEIPF